MANGTTPAEMERIRLLGQLAGAEAKAPTVTRRHAQQPDFAAIVQKRALPDELTPHLVKAADRPETVYQDKEVAKSFFTAIDVCTDANTVQWCADLLIDCCRENTIVWNRLATLEDTRGCPAQQCCYHAFCRDWGDNTGVSDSLAYLLTGLESYRQAVEDPRPMYKQIIDPTVKNLSSTGRLAAISNLLKNNSLRLDLAHSSTLRNVLVSGFQSKQLGDMYHSAISLWLLTFNKAVIAEHGPLYIHRSLLRGFIEMISVCKFEKVVRAALHCLKNLISEEWIFEVLFHKRIDHVLTLLEVEKWRDPEIYEELEGIMKTIYQKLSQMSNFSRYVKELDSGKFIPGPLHTEKFWIENVHNFEDNEFGPIRKLAKLVHTCSDLTTLSLAIFDLGEFCRLHPTGKLVMMRTGAKPKIMELMNHPNKEVAREALLATQKMMLDNWKELGGEAQEKHRKGLQG